MEGQLFELLYSLIVPLGKLRARTRGQVYRDYQIALILLWAALWNRPRSWALKLENWQGRCPWATLPSEGTVSRRARSIGVWLLFCQLLDLLNAALPASMFKRIDAHPLAVGGASKDKEAKCGFGAGKLVKGYKLHEIRSGQDHLDAWTFTPMSEREQTAAATLMTRLTGSGYLVGDNGYDSNALYQLAGSQGYQLVAPPRATSKARGHHRHAPQRLRGLALLENPLACAGQPPTFGQDLLKDRRAIERNFAHEQTTPCCHLGPLPFWVRTPHRVGPWILCKLILYYGQRRLKTKDLRAA